MKNLIKIFILCASFYSNLLIAKNFEIPSEGIVIKNITCESPSSPANNQDRYKLITMLIYNKNNYPIKSKFLNFDLYDEDGDRLFSHGFILQMDPRTAVKEVLSVPECNDSFFGRKTSYKFSIKI
tara:strand:+ start:252 stop:626 length:375 start_codon:yes stop_codon:yes gene_type:complete